jgi:hypothetical protein
MNETNQGGIVRVTKNRSNPYTIVLRATFEDETLSWEARGVLAYLLCKPDNWQIRHGDLVKRGPGGRDRMYRILGELEQAGYIKRVLEQDERGQFMWYSEIYETPQPFTEKPYTAKPDTANTYLNNKSVVASSNDNNYSPETDVLGTGNETTRPQPEPPPDRPVIRRGKNVAMPLPDDFALTDSMRDWAKENAPTLDVSRETERFKVNALAHGRTYKNWLWAWKQWMLSPYQEQGANVRSNGNSYHPPTIATAIPSEEETRADVARRLAKPRHAYIKPAAPDDLPF